MKKLTLPLVALTLLAAPSHVEAQNQVRSRDSLTVVPTGGGSPRQIATAPRTTAARAAKPVIQETGRRGSLGRTAALGRTGSASVVRDLPSRRVVNSVPVTSGRVGAVPPRTDLARRGLTQAYPHRYASQSRQSYSSPTYYASQYGYSPNYGSSYYGSSALPSYYGSYQNPLYTGSGYAGGYYGSNIPTSYYSPGSYYPTSTYSVTGLTGSGYYPVVTRPDPIQTNVVDWGAQTRAVSSYSDAATYSAPTQQHYEPQPVRRTQQRTVREYQQTIEK